MAMPEHLEILKQGMEVWDRWRRDLTISLPDKNTYVALVMLDNGTEPKLFLFPSTVWLRPTSLFVSRDYEGKKSKPEWGINISKKNMPELNEYSFEKTIQTLTNIYTKLQRNAKYLTLMEVTRGYAT